MQRPVLKVDITLPSSPPVRVFFPCTGLGRQRRGFEAFTLQCAAALVADTRLSITVFAGAPTTGTPVRVIRNLPRDSRPAAWLGRLAGREAYFIEQLTFFLAFLPHLVRGRPDVVYFADLNLGNLCWHWRRVSGQRYTLLFYNGGLTTKPFTRADFIQQLTPAGMREAAERGEDPARQILLPHGVQIPAELPSRILGADRVALDLPADRQVVLSVGLLDSAIKRMDALIREIAALPAPRPFLVLLGAENEETDAVRRLAAELLGSGNVLIRTVRPDDVSRHYRAADVFALASLREGFGLAYVEALAHGLPVVAHDTEVTRYLLGPYATLVDATVPGAMSRAIEAALARPLPDDERAARHASARQRFGWDALRMQYAAMLLRAAAE